MAYQKSEFNDDAYSKEERWNCEKCHKILELIHAEKANDEGYAQP
jgi:hypothetical protein